MNIDQFVQANIISCQSELVSLLTSPEAQEIRSRLTPCPLQDLLGQAEEISYPIADFDETAVQLGYDQQQDGTWSHTSNLSYATSQDVCTEHDAEPYYWEVFEFWQVTSYLAGQLTSRGEQVDLDFAGMQIWARTTTGQSIALDGVIQRIFKATGG
ncbi:hypothetical protein [Bradyrhizobium erythrophlei]|uniref:Uncharacterized protein n=1 Tax=Bradyrhizobium erythrophlei TaxID=1437360 RepID=A0A1M5T9C3_9BRAD|nr:hypothetical protein [Bradyrhizobium erythrophlei]SHH47312.1 hypothetical protein SAMN05444169_7627 [Bradyrhizobium erythrophlei]